MNAAAATLARRAIIDTLGRDRVIEALAKRLHYVSSGGHPLRDAYKLNNTLARAWWSKR